MSHRDYAVLIIIVLTIMLIGYLQGIAIGILLSVILFTLQTSRLNVIKHTLSGVTYRSTVDRSAPHCRQLQTEGERIAIYILDGLIFFGTASSLFNRIRQRIDDSARPSLNCLLLDFGAVKSIDSSAVLTFLKLRQQAEKHRFALVFTRLKPDMARIFQASGFDLQTVHCFDLLDEGMEWCENQLLDHPDSSVLPGSLRQQLEALFPDLEWADDFTTHWQRQQLEAGAYLTHQNEPGDTIFFVQSGELTVRLTLPDGSSKRLRKVGAGSIIGEIALYLHQHRSASILAERPSVVYSFADADLQRLETDHPQAAAAFHKFIARVLAERLADNTARLAD